MKTGIAILALVLATAGTAAAAPACFSKGEHRAHAVRQLQTELMVAALSCKDQSLDLRGRYGAFVSKFGPKLVENADTLRGYFARAYGKGGHMRQFDAYITSLANEASRRSMNDDGYCDEVRPLFDKALAIEGKELESFAVASIKDHGGRCVAAN